VPTAVDSRLLGNDQREGGMMVMLGALGKSSARLGGCTPWESDHVESV
jgi:hypothetical protein